MILCIFFVENCFEYLPPQYKLLACFKYDIVNILFICIIYLQKLKAINFASTFN
jgi:hypothetical protein